MLRLEFKRRLSKTADNTPMNTNFLTRFMPLGKSIETKLAGSLAFVFCTLGDEEAIISRMLKFVSTGVHSWFNSLSGSQKTVPTNRIVKPRIDTNEHKFPGSFHATWRIN